MDCIDAIDAIDRFIAHIYVVLLIDSCLLTVDMPPFFFCETPNIDAKITNVLGSRSTNPAIHQYPTTLTQAPLAAVRDSPA
jgi:hypothetical protein